MRISDWSSDVCSSDLMLHANLSYRLDANTFVVGLTLNILALGMTSFLLETIDMTPHRAGQVTVPLLHDIPIIGEPLFVNRWTIYLLLLAVPLSWLVVQRTRWGLELRACGEDPQAAEDQKSVGSGTSVSVRVDLGGRRI